MLIYIYKLCCKDCEIDNIYIGSTSRPLYKRYHDHKYQCSNIKGTYHNNYKYEFIRLNGGIDNWEIIEIERYDVIDTQEKLKYERLWFDILKPDLNTVKPYVTKSERQAQQKLHENTPERKEQKLLYENTPERKEQKLLYENTPERKTQNKQYKHTLIICQKCNLEIKRQNMKYHIKKICKIK
jgi:hypothetical protein